MNIKLDYSTFFHTEAQAPLEFEAPGEFEEPLVVDGFRIWKPIRRGVSKTVKKISSKWKDNWRETLSNGLKNLHKLTLKLKSHYDNARDCVDFVKEAAQLTCKRFESRNLQCNHH